MSAPSAAALPSWLRATSDGWVLALHVQPGAKRTAWSGVHGDALKLRLAAPPVDGKANDALQRFLADTLEVRRQSVLLLSGQTSRDKRLGLPSDVTLPQLLALADA